MSNANYYNEAVQRERDRINSPAYLNRKRRCPVCGPKMEKARKKFLALLDSTREKHRKSSAPGRGEG